MTEADPERLLTEALRAQAARTPLPEATVSGYGLLSNNDLPLTPLPDPPPHPEPAAPPPRMWWVLMLALLLGLAAGAVVGFLTLL
ncbi:hypothetical protein [Actinokineospora iranica]|uniref:Uncharacterized protein n=1 Tax=Actinokineospora iranica TaxID=1271860 RepID=A0A1G6Q607_9PSEU|nr:hypothetical protein [Actinokineospora iranica]SDC87671.1 hypothetical protein SAMN05216174_105106 [Actinokineospora iranica]